MSKQGEMSQQFASWLWDAMRSAGYPPEPDRRLAGRTRFAAAAGISLSTVTRALDIGRVPEPEILRKMAPALRRSIIEAYVAAGYLTPQEAGMLTDTPSPAQIADVAEAIRQDSELMERAREHLLSQYQMLRELSEHASSKNPRQVQTSPASQRPLRAVARKRAPRQDRP